MVFITATESKVEKLSWRESDLAKIDASALVLFLSLSPLGHREMQLYENLEECSHLPHSRQPP